MSNSISRRAWLKAMGASAAAGWFGLPSVDGAAQLQARTRTPRPRLPIAAVVTEYRPSSHADVIVGKILEGYLQDRGTGPDLQLVAMYVDQVPETDMSRDLAARYGFRLAPTIDEAITLGSDRVQVAGVLSIGEHGDYPMTPDTHQQMYPRRRFFDEIVGTFRRCGQVVPVFNDKHLSYRWEDARYMVDTAREMRIPFMAGSSVPVAWRLPASELPLDSEIEAILTIGYGGLEAYGYHALEAHQSLIERGRGDVSVAAVQAVQGDEIWKAATAQRWSPELMEAALAVIPGVPPGQREEQFNGDAAAYLLEHRGGLRSAVVMANGLVAQFACAVKLAGRLQPLATWFKLQEGPPFSHFAYLLRAIEEMVHTGQPGYPVERTLVTTGVLDRVMHSLAGQGQRLETPELRIRYAPGDWPFANHPQARLHLPEP